MNRTCAAITVLAVLLTALGSQAFAEEGAFLGVEVTKLTDAWRSKLDCKGDGVVVLSVVEGGPAETAGIEEGDVIKKIAGQAVVSPGGLQRIIDEKKPEDSVKVELSRKGEPATVAATLKGRPGILNDLPGRVKRYFYMPDGGRGALDVRRGPSGGTRGMWIGVRIEKVEGQLAKHFGVEKGLLIAEVLEGAPAEKAELKAGDVILEADGTALETIHALKETVETKKAKETVKLKIVRDGKEMTVDVSVEENPHAGREPGSIRSWFKELQERLGTPPVKGHGPCGDGDKPCDHGDKPCTHGKPAGDVPKGMWGAQEELNTQMDELRERVEKTERELKALREKMEAK
jgi:membrane-associated protease RseP (regulator of RpoE activity)